MHIELCIISKRMHALSKCVSWCLLLAQFSTLTDLAGDGPRAESCFDTIVTAPLTTQHQFRFPPLSTNDHCKRRGDRERCYSFISLPLLMSACLRGGPKYSRKTHTEPSAKSPVRFTFAAKSVIIF